jgi:uncharacterized SAM-binding protein YcdF (DUF218 family)
MLLAKALMGLSILTLVGVVWLACGWPIGLDRWLDVSTAPVPAAAIVCLGGGTTSTKLPLPNGWERIDTTAQLFADGLAPAVVFSGGGTGAVSETEIYANAAVWLGVPRTSIAFEPLAQDTAGHARALIGLALPNGQRIERDTAILVVTSAFHSRRALMTFRRAGFSNVRVVSRYTAKRRVPGTPAAMTNTVAAYHPSGKSYNDVLFRLAYRSFDFLICARELAALSWYWWRGEV